MHLINRLLVVVLLAALIVLSSAAAVQPTIATPARPALQFIEFFSPM